MYISLSFSNLQFSNPVHVMEQPVHVEVCHSAVMSLFHLLVFPQKSTYAHGFGPSVSHHNICFVDRVTVHRITGNSCMTGCETHQLVLSLN